MPDMWRGALLALSALLFTGAEGQRGNYTSSRHLWYNTPGTDFASGLAIGTGRIGAVVYGSATEQISLNEASVWSGPFQNRTNPRSLKSFPVARSLLVNGNYTEAGNLVLRDMSSIPTTNRWFSVTNGLQLEFGHSQDKWTNYERWLDTIEGHTGLSYDYQGVTYSREYIANFQTGVIAIRLTASQPRKLNVNVTMSRTKGVLGLYSSTQNNTITLDVGGPAASAIPFTAAVRVQNDGGSISTTASSGLSVVNANTVDLFYDAETSFQWSSEAAYKQEVTRKLTQAVSQNYTALRTQARNDHSKLASRVQLDLGSGGINASLPTNQRIDAYRGNPDPDPSFITLAYNFGRHLLIASSRDTGGPGLAVPANLQGIWNEYYQPPWGSKYTVNINTEMNYWLAETTNLPDTLRPLWDLLQRSRVKGADVAKTMYGCPGYVSHHNLDIWGDSTPHDNGTQWTMWPMSNLWLTQHAMEHYRFTGNKVFLRDIAWPLFKDAATFFDCYLFQFEGFWATGPSISPENAFILTSGPESGSKAAIDISTTMDMSLLYNLFTNIIESADALNISLASDPVLAKVKSYRAGLRPTLIGSKGQILEYRKEYKESEPSHRHISHLWDLFPGSRMSPLINQTLANAARTSLNLRLSAGGAATGWSRIWTAACFARLLDGENALFHIQALLKENPKPNMFNGISRGGVFQIDSNLGLVAAVTETLLQSHAGVVHLLPALSQKLATGSVSGLVARGGFIVSVSWKNGAFTTAQILSQLGGTLSVRVADGKAFKINGASVQSVETKAGSKYAISL